MIPLNTAFMLIFDLSQCFFQLISAQQLPKPEGSVSKIDTIDPYIVVRVIGIPADSHEYRTYAVKNNGKFTLNCCTIASLISFFSCCFY